MGHSSTTGYNRLDVRHEPGQTQHLGYHGNLTLSPCISTQHLPGMQHNKDLSVIMQRHAPFSVTLQYVLVLTLSMHPKTDENTII